MSVGLRRIKRMNNNITFIKLNNQPLYIHNIFPLFHHARSCWNNESTDDFPLQL